MIRLKIIKEKRKEIQMQPKIKGVVIKEVDKKLFKYLHAVKVATYKQITRDIYQEYKLKSVVNRLNKLEDNKLIAGYRSRQLNNCKVVHLTNTGFKMFVCNEESKFVKLKSESVLHDLDLVDIRYNLLKSPRICSYYTENQLQAWGSYLHDGKLSPLLGMNFDGVVEIQFKKSVMFIPVEYEKYEKYSLRYEVRLKKLHSSDEVPIIFYVCKTKEILNRLWYLERKLLKGRKPKLFLKLLTEFKEDKSLVFTNCNNDSLAIGKNIV